MNIKYIALFFLIFVTGTQAMTRAEILEQAKKKFNQCRQKEFNRREVLIPCDKEEQAFLQAREEFLAPLYENISKGEQASAEYTKAISEANEEEKYYDAFTKHAATIVKAGVSKRVAEAFKYDTHFLDCNAPCLAIFDRVCDGINERFLPEGAQPLFPNDAEQIRKTVIQALKQEIRNQ
jgi:hypothetical protein